MSQNKKLSKEARRAKKEAREEQQAKSVIKWIAGSLLLLTVLLIGALCLL